MAAVFRTDTLTNSAVVAPRPSCVVLEGVLDFAFKVHSTFHAAFYPDHYLQPVATECCMSFSKKPLSIRN